ncbi:MAG: GNAT family N-acetyltransferase [Pseudomonadota bacterium]
MTAQTPSIQKRGANDSQQVADILADAFQHDPCMNFVIPVQELYSSFYKLLADQLYLPQGLVFTDNECNAAAMWLPPGTAPDVPMSLSQLGLLFRLFIRQGPRVIPRLQQASAVMAQNHPKTPHYYLQAIGAKSGFQGRGLGSALLKHMTHRVDKESMPCYLESSSPANVPLYQRHGFEITGQAPIAQGGPPLIFMWREPQSQTE